MEGWTDLYRLSNGTLTGISFRYQDEILRPCERPSSKVIEDTVTMS